MAGCTARCPTHDEPCATLLESELDADDKAALRFFNGPGAQPHGHSCVACMTMPRSRSAWGASEPA